MDGRANLDERLVIKIDERATAIEVDVDKALYWQVGATTKAAHRVKRAKSGVGDYVDDVLAVAAAATSVKVGRHQLDLGELRSSVHQDSLLMEFKGMLEESDVEGEENGDEEDGAKASGTEATEGDGRPPLATPMAGAGDTDFCVDFDFDVNLEISNDYIVGASAGSGISGNGIGCGNGGSSGSGSASGDTSVANESLAETLARLKLRNRNVNFPRDVETIAGIEASTVHAQPVRIGRVYLMWGRAYKAVRKCHPQCSIMLNLNWFREEAQAQQVLYEWLVRALLTNEDKRYAESR